MHGQSKDNDIRGYQMPCGCGCGLIVIILEINTCIFTLLYTHIEIIKSCWVNPGQRSQKIANSSKSFGNLSVIIDANFPTIICLSGIFDTVTNPFDNILDIYL